MRIGLSLPGMLGDYDRERFLQWCHRIEGDGWDTLGMGERIAYRNHEMFTTLSAAAAVTERVRIAATLVVLPMHSEVWVAKQAATLDVLSGGRLTLGVGVGGREEDYRALGRSFQRRFDRLDAQVARLRELWAGEPPGEGLDEVGPRPVQDAIPILSGALGPRSLRRSARWADGIAGFELDPNPKSLARWRAGVDGAWEEAGRDRSPYRMTSFWFALGDDPEAQLRSYARHYLGVFGEELAGAMADACTVAGADALRRAVAACREAGVDEIQLVPTTSDPAELDRLAAAIADVR